MFIDISYPMRNDMAIYPGNPAFHIEKISDVKNGDSVTISRIALGSHTGTHIDSPAHFLIGGLTVDQIPLERMNGKAKVLDLTGHDDITRELLETQIIEEEDIVLFKTDNSLNWKCDTLLEDYVTLTYEAAEYLAFRKVKAIGIDYLSIERPRNKRNKEKSVHRILLEKKILIC